MHNIRLFRRYPADHIELYFQIMDDAVLKKLLDKEEWLKDYVNEISYKRMTFERPEISFTYGNCSIEMHDTSISFLKIHTTGKIVFSNMSCYNTTNEGNIIELSKDNFSGAIISSHELSENSDGIVAENDVMFRGMDTRPLSDRTDEIKTVEGAIKTGTLGGEITIVRKDGKYVTDSISYYANVTIKNGTLSPEKAEFTVSGDDHTTGKTVKINVGKDAMSSKNLKVTFDGEEIPMADSLADVLDPNNDGLQPEYVKVNVSEHTITLESLAKNPVFMGMAAVSATAVVIAAAWGMFRKRESNL